MPNRLVETIRKNSKNGPLLFRFLIRLERTDDVRGLFGDLVELISPHLMIKSYHIDSEKHWETVTQIFTRCCDLELTPQLDSLVSQTLSGLQSLSRWEIKDVSSSMFGELAMTLRKNARLLGSAPLQRLYRGMLKLYVSNPPKRPSLHF